MPAWTPAQIITNLWLDPSDTSTIYDASSGGSLTADGGNVGRLEDKSGNARHAIQATSGNRPVRNGSAISFVDKWLSVPTAAWAFNRLLIGVFNSSATGWVSGGIINIESTGPIENPELRWGIGAAGNFCGHYWAGGYAVNQGISYGLATESVHATAIETGGVLTQWQNGTQTATGTRAATWASIGEFTIGKFLRYSTQLGRSGSVKELIVCSPADRVVMEGYLAWKHGLQASLPSGHTYESAAPTTSTSPRRRTAQASIRSTF